MFVISVSGRESDSIYYAIDENKEEVIYFFEEVDDAVRFAMMLEDDGYPQMVVTEVDREVAIQSCEVNDCKYAIITKNDFVVPQEGNRDFI